VQPIIQTIRPSGARKWLKRLGLVVFVFVVGIFGVYWTVQHKFDDKIFSVETAPQEDVAVVFGAGLKFKDWPGDFLRDRILIALELYKEGKVGKIMMSGDSADLSHDEVRAMVNFAVTQGIGEENLILDPLGLSTLDTCVRLKNVFNIDRAVLVTQSAHLGRAMYVCNKTGVDAVGVASDLSASSGMWKFRTREFFASLAAWWGLK
jgi:vancomycin permeability regulator SanA